MSFRPDEFAHVQYLWDDTVANRLDGVDRLVYRSNLLGVDPRITNTGGGNTSSKLKMPDPLTGQMVDVLWVKGSGGDLRTAQRSGFASFYIDRLLSLQKLYLQTEVRGVKTEIEDRMVAMYRHCTFDLNPAVGSIDTPLHAFIPFRHIDHSHPVSVITIAACEDQERLTRQVYGDEVGWVPWQRPGFDLGLVLQAMIRKNPHIKGIILGQHGLINWAEDDKACYELTLTLIEKAARYIEQCSQPSAIFGGQKYGPLEISARERFLTSLLPRLRGLVSHPAKMIATVQSSPEVLQFVNSIDAARLAELGTSCPDHFLRTKIKPLYVEWDPRRETGEVLVEKLDRGIRRYREDYTKYYLSCMRPDSPPIRNPNPTVILIPGLGMLAYGKNKSESRVTAEFYGLAIDFMRGSETISRYQGLPRQEAFDIEYWALEEAKLRRMPPEKEMERAVAVVVGAGSGIGKAVAQRVAREGAQVVCADLDADGAGKTAQEIMETTGNGIGVSGTGISACGPAVGIGVDITLRESVQALFDQVILAYGGIDHVIITAGIYITPEPQGVAPESQGVAPEPPGANPELPGAIRDDQWALTYAVNVIGEYIVADEARKIWQSQKLPGSLVLTTSVNGVVAKAGSLAYDTSKAAANHLVRELAIELAPYVRVNGLSPATVIEGSSMFPRERVVASLRKYNVSYGEDESTEGLREKLAQFYAQRTLLKSPVRVTDQAEIAYLLCTDKFARTTGQIIQVDAGLPEAFLR